MSLGFSTLLEGFQESTIKGRLGEREGSGLSVLLSEIDLQRYRGCPVGTFTPHVYSLRLVSRCSVLSGDRFRFFEFFAPSRNGILAVRTYAFRGFGLFFSSIEAPLVGA